MPDGGGYIAAAYLVFLAIVLVYVVIMATRLSRLERELARLNDAAAPRHGARSEETSQSGRVEVA